MLNNKQNFGNGPTNMTSDQMKRFALGLVFAALVLAAAPAMADLRTEGSVAPDFTLNTLDGKAISLSGLRGKPVLLEFWTTWCGICRRQFPDMIKAQEKYGDDVQFVLVNTAEDGELVRKFAEKTGLAGTILLDPNDDVGEMYGTKILPTVFFVDADGIIQAAHAGAIGDVDEFMTAMMKRSTSP